MSSMRTVAAPRLLKLWSVFFAYGCIASLLLQLVVIPYGFKTSHWGHGLIHAGGDAVEYHMIASQVADKVHQHGWSAWQLFPGKVSPNSPPLVPYPLEKTRRGQAPAGIASAVYAMTYSEPWILIPIHAALHALAALMLLLIVERFLPNRRSALLCVLPFFLYPSVLSWYGQIYREPYTNAGNLVFLWGFIVLVAPHRDSRSKVQASVAIVGIALSAVVITVMRAYEAPILRGFTCAFVGIGVIYWACRWIARECDARRFASTAVTLLTALAVTLSTLTAVVAITRRTHPENVAVEPADLAEELAIVNALNFSWQTTKVVPNVIDRRFEEIATAREKFLHVIRTAAIHPATAIDEEIAFRKASDVIAYVPRALQQALFSPFPTQWLPGKWTAAKSESSRWMRRGAAFETACNYLALLFLPLSIWFWRKRIELWMLIFFCMSMLLLEGLVIANTGTLFRHRFPYVMTLVAIGSAGFLTLLQQYKRAQVAPSDRRALDSVWSFFRGYNA